jgi:hypothetical protein
MDEVCIYCNAESVDGDLTGWVQEEFGFKCPECRVLHKDAQQPGGAAGLGGFDGVLDISEEEA